MASLIVFNSNGKATWIALRSGAHIMHKLTEYHVPSNVEFTKEDLAFFRKPLSK